MCCFHGCLVLTSASQPIRPTRSSFRVPGRPAPTPPAGVEPASLRITHLPLQLGPLPQPPPLQRHPTVPARNPRPGHVSRSSLSHPSQIPPNPTAQQHTRTLSASRSAGQLNNMASQPLSQNSGQQQQTLRAPINPPHRSRSLRQQTYHALMPEHATVSDLAVPEEDDSNLPSGKASGELAVLTDHTGRRCSIIAIKPSVGRKAKCHYDPFVRRRTMMAFPDVNNDSVRSALSVGGASGIFVRSEGTSRTAFEDRVSRPFESRVGQFV
ncbi:hypothetical protein CC85DRAFT_99352 [Cutaneotrichosporon oleaginosum]|uniref:Uncharacterized protein n=1 Tax=Cutaneotrichosporon oleaginosum TaxID=879819 RepID=A0A0J0XLX6_9TREE|nr:uncharacterized protein CC85DRAFT_99352 [Cutaneotrichosporon oleaginosum]KLT42107.1 hypothetical protein CC85DRAFT_99352 [Cutaneotrichosporon oleaginosum]TXT04654.1 hypothetical protein COLE_07473 [Cutaneotrichosporon oleaginosum]